MQGKQTHQSSRQRVYCQEKRPQNLGRTDKIAFAHKFQSLSFITPFKSDAGMALNDVLIRSKSRAPPKRRALDRHWKPKRTARVRPACSTDWQVSSISSRQTNKACGHYSVSKVYRLERNVRVTPLVIQSWDIGSASFVLGPRCFCGLTLSFPG
jgi:hypothetical protein